MLGGDPGGPKSFGRVRLECRGELRIPTEILETNGLGHCSLPGRSSARREGAATASIGPGGGDYTGLGAGTPGYVSLQ